MRPAFKWPYCLLFNHQGPADRICERCGFYSSYDFMCRGGYIARVRDWFFRWREHYFGVCEDCGEPYRKGEHDQCIPF